MTIQIFSNNAKSTLAAPISSSATTITVDPGTGVLFPNPSAGQQFKVTLNSALSPSVYEICNCTARSTDSLTVIRGQEGTTNLPFLINDVVGHFDTAGVMTDLLQSEQLQQGKYQFAVAGGTANSLTATLTSNLTTLPDGLSFVLEATLANTGASALVLTLGSTVLASHPLVKAGNISLVAADIPLAGYPIQICWSATFNAYVMQNPGFNFATAVTETQLQQQTYIYAVATGGSDTLLATYLSALTTLSDGMTFSVNPIYSNTTTTPTINVTLGSTATGVKSIVKGSNIALAIGDIQLNAPILLTYSSTLGKWILLNPFFNPTTLGTMAFENSNNVSITGGAISGLSPALSVASGGTGLGTITANNVILGNGVSAVQVIPPSNSGNLLTSNGLTWASAAPIGVGINQTWQNLTASRFPATIYTNSTGKPILVTIGKSCGTSSDWTVTVNSVQVAYGASGAGGSAGMTATFIVPNGGTYLQTNVVGVIITQNWSELS